MPDTPGTRGAPGAPVVKRRHRLCAFFLSGLLVLGTFFFGTSFWLAVRAADRPGEALSYRILEDLPPDVGSWRETYKQYPGLFTFTARDTTYLLISWGEKRTGGYILKLNGMRREKDVVVADVSLKAPAPEDAVVQVITYPHLVVALPATEAPFAAEFTGADWDPKGEGLPLCSTDFFIKTPLPMDPVSGSLRVTGAAKVLGATFRLSIEDGHDELGSVLVITSQKAPAWGTFDVQLPFRKPSNPVGHLVFSVRDTQDGPWIEKMGLPVRFEAKGSGDLPDVRGHWGEPTIRRAAGRGFVAGYPNGNFHPDRDITRAEFIRVVATAFGLHPMIDPVPGFVDTTKHWASPYVNAALNRGILAQADYPERRFEPDRPITRLEMAVQLVRALGKQDQAAKPENVETARGYRDAADVPPELRGYLGVITRLGITTGFPDSTFGPHRRATRAQATAMIMRALDTEDAARVAAEFFRHWGQLDLDRMRSLMLVPPEKFIPDSDIVFAPFYPKKYPDEVPAFLRASRDLIRQYDAAAWENINIQESRVYPTTSPYRVMVHLRLGQAPYDISADMVLADEGGTGWRVRMLDSLPIRSEEEVPPSSYSLDRLQPMEVRDMDGIPGAEVLGFAFWGEYEGTGPERSGARGLFTFRDGKLTRLWSTTEGPSPGWVWTGEGAMGHLTSPESFDLLLVSRPANLDGKPVSEEGPQLALYGLRANRASSAASPASGNGAFESAALEKVAEIPWPRVAPPDTKVYYGLMAARPLDDEPGDEVVISAFCTPPTGSAYQLVVIARLEGTSLKVLATHKSAAGQSLYLTFAPPPEGTFLPYRLYVWTWRGDDVTALTFHDGTFAFTSLPLNHQTVLAAADLDGDGRDEFLVETPYHRLQVLAKDGALLWETDAYKGVGLAWMGRVAGKVTLVTSEPAADANRIVRWEEAAACAEVNGGERAAGQLESGQPLALSLKRTWVSPALGKARISSLWVTDLNADGAQEILVTSTSEFLAPADYLHVFDLASGTLSTLSQTNPATKTLAR